jgi:o-succinylbenzoate---CoA ligase
MDRIPNWLMKRAFLTPERTAIIYKNKQVTFQQLHQHVLKKANQLHAAGIQKGHFVGVLMKNSLEMAEIIHALKYIGAVTVLLNTRLTAEELTWQLKDSTCTYLVTEQLFKDKYAEIQQHFPQLSVIVKEEMDSSKEKQCQIQQEFIMDEVDTIMYTSGTTGKPKGVMQTYGNHWWSAVSSSLNLGLDHKDCWLAAVPFFHISGLSILIRSVIYGISVIIHDSFDANEANKAIMEKNVTIMSVVSSMLSQMINELGEKKYPVSFRCMLLGGGPAPKALLEKCLEKKIPVYQTYGMTETASQISTLSPEYSLSKIGSAGKPLFPASLKIMKNGREAEAFEHGEIVVKGPNVAKGYLYKEEATAEAFKEGWFHTGDIGYLDEEGFLYVLDRRSDLIISGGENIYPAEVESVLLMHDEIVDAGVVGIPNERWGQVPVACVVRVKGSSVNEAKIMEFCEKRLARYKVPNLIFFFDELPRNASKKLMRRKLKEMLKTRLETNE